MSLNNKVVYISGSIANCSNFHENFDKVESILKNYGLIVINPADLAEGLTRRDYMRINLAQLESADAVLMLDNWKDSEGSNIERLYAMYIGIPVFYSIQELLLIKRSIE